MRPLKLARGGHDDATRTNPVIHELPHHDLRSGEAQLEVRGHRPHHVGVTDEDDAGPVIGRCGEARGQTLELLELRLRDLGR
jgi:hypothetical protein